MFFFHGDMPLNRVSFSGFLLQAGADPAISATGLLRRRRNEIGGPGAKPPEKFLSHALLLLGKRPFFLGNALLKMKRLLSINPVAMQFYGHATT